MTDEFVVFRKLAPEIPSTTYATFALIKYPAKFIPQVISYALKTYGRPGMSVFDPFAGYGTVGAVARLYGTDYELWDLNPLLAHLHAVAVARPACVDPDRMVGEMASWKGSFVPGWSRMGYWFPPELMPLLSGAWGFYHSLEDTELRRALLIPLLKATRYFSYNDQGRQKLSRSPVASKRIATLLGRDWQSVFFQMVRNGLHELRKKQTEYSGLGPKPVEATVRAGVDSLSLDLGRERDILITSPPYLQAQEYMRAAKLDLFWLGHSEEQVNELRKTEIPYRHVSPCPIHSPTYYEHLQQVQEPHLRRLFEQYFHGVLGALTRLQEGVRSHLLLFVGPATVRSRPVPIGRIFAEHFTSLGWRHEKTLIDTIAARTMFFYQANPETGLRDQRMLTEHLVVLSRK